MPREYAQNRIAMWDDDNFRQLTDSGQCLYNYLLAHPSTTYIGAVDWRPARLQTVNVSWTTSRVNEIGSELAERHYIVIDEDTEEAVIRSFLRWESVLKSPNLARAAAKAFFKLQSRTLRGVVVHEMNRLKTENPDWAAWDLGEIDEVLEAAEPIDAKAGTLRETLPSTLPGTPTEGFGDGSSKGSAITSNRKQVTGNPEHPTSNQSTRASDAETGESSEVLCKRQLLSLNIDYDKVRIAIGKACGRIPDPTSIVRVAVGILAKAEDVARPTPYIVKSISNDWAVWQKFLDAAEVA